MDEILDRIVRCIEFGKVSSSSPYPPDMKGQEGADELTLRALESGLEAQSILSDGLIAGMRRVAEKFRANQVFVPQVLMSARAMRAAMEHLRPYFASGSVKRKGTFIIGTVRGDLHDIGKNIVSMIIEGNGYEVIDLGVDVQPERFLAEMDKYPAAFVGLSALLTTTMPHMQQTVEQIKQKDASRIVCIGGAPVSERFCKEIGADFYSSDPQEAVAYLDDRSGL